MNKEGTNTTFEEMDLNLTKEPNSSIDDAKTTPNSIQEVLFSFLVPNASDMSQQHPASITNAVQSLSSLSALRPAVLPLLTNTSKTLLPIEWLMRNRSFFNDSYPYGNDTYGWVDGSWYEWLPEFNLTGNRGGGVAHQNDKPVESISVDDAAWVLTATFIIFTMQSGR